jgi:regulator of RNase E activity RraA
MTVNPGDLIHADRRGALTIPGNSDLQSALGADMLYPNPY